jgi:hypothetical protein
MRTRSRLGAIVHIELVIIDGSTLDGEELPADRQPPSDRRPRGGSPLPSSYLARPPGFPRRVWEPGETDPRARRWYRCWWEYSSLYGSGQRVRQPERREVVAADE